MAVVYALISALAFGTGDVLTRLGVRSGTPLVGALTSGIVMLFVFAIPVFFANSITQPLWPGAGWFFAVGILLTGPGRILYYNSVRRIGVARATVLINVSPLVGMLSAVIFLGERPSLWIIIGAFLIVGGLTGMVKDPGGIHISPRNLFWGILPTLFFALTPLFMRIGMQSLPDPILGSFISAMGGIVFLLAFQPTIPRDDRWKTNRKAMKIFVIAGLVHAIAFATYYGALEQGEVSVVAPLVYLSPLLSVLIARMFLQNLEQVTWRLIAGGVSVFLGVVIISLFRAS